MAAVALSTAASFGCAAGADTDKTTPARDAAADGSEPVTVVVIGPGADPSAPSKFGAPDDPAHKIVLAYPADGIVVPPNMKALEVHFTPPATGADLFELRFDSPTISLAAYFGCLPTPAPGCRYATTSEFWSQLATANRGAAPVKYRVRGVDSNAPGKLAVSDSHTIAFANEDVVGGIYFWNIAGVIERYDFGISNQTPEPFLTPQAVGAATCVGCHALSRDGKRIAVGFDNSTEPAPYRIYDVATRTPLLAGGVPVGGNGYFFSFAPDGTKLLVSDGLKIDLQDIASGAIESANLIPAGTMPDWSPDGDFIVYSKPGPAPKPGPSIGTQSASLELVSYSNGGVGSPNVLVPFAGQNSYYPTFSPDGDWVAYSRSASDKSSLSAAPPNGDGEVWVVNVATGATARLDAANHGGSSSWPKWVPSVGSYYGGKLMWLTISSGRAYGLRSLAGMHVQLWMMAFDPARGKQGADPSLPAFWLPFQDVAGDNRIAQWVTTVVRKPCKEDAQCETGESCESGSCIPIVK